MCENCVKISSFFREKKNTQIKIKIKKYKPCIVLKQKQKQKRWTINSNANFPSTNFLFATREIIPGCQILASRVPSNLFVSFVRVCF